VRGDSVRDGVAACSSGPEAAAFPDVSTDDFSDGASRSDLSPLIQMIALPNTTTAENPITSGSLDERRSGCADPSSSIESLTARLEGTRGGGGATPCNVFATPFEGRESGAGAISAGDAIGGCDETTGASDRTAEEGELWARGAGAAPPVPKFAGSEETASCGLAAGTLVGPIVVATGAMPAAPDPFGGEDGAWNAGEEAGRGPQGAMGTCEAVGAAAPRGAFGPTTPTAEVGGASTERGAGASLRAFAASGGATPIIVPPRCSRAILSASARVHPTP
jgi:hypothetical protein